MRTLSVDQRLEEMSLALGVDYLHFRILFWWYRRFQTGNLSLEDAERIRKPQTSVTEESVTNACRNTRKYCQIEET